MELLSAQKCHTGTLVKEIKEKLSVMAYNYPEAFETDDNCTIEEKSFELPDGQILEVNHKMRYTSAELLLNPLLVSSNETQLIDNIYDSLMRIDKDLRKVMFNNIVLCGGASMCRNLHARLMNDLNENCPSH